MIHNLFIAHGAINGFGHVIPNMMKKWCSIFNLAVIYKC
jgi:hypothetical protein